MAGAGRGWQNKWKSSGNAPASSPGHAPATGRGAGTLLYHISRESRQESLEIFWGPKDISSLVDDPPGEEVLKISHVPAWKVKFLCTALVHLETIGNNRKQCARHMCRAHSFLSILGHVNLISRDLITNSFQGIIRGCQKHVDAQGSIFTDE